jgi:hypothetical protein
VTMKDHYLQAKSCESHYTRIENRGKTSLAPELIQDRPSISISHDSSDVTRAVPDVNRFAPGRDNGICTRGEP